LLNNDFLSRNNTFFWYRPVDYSGSTVAAGTGGGTPAWNNRGVGYLSHGAAGAKYEIINTGPTSIDDTHLIWDFEVTNPYLPQPTTQALVTTPFGNSGWGSYAQDLEVRSKLAYSAAYNGTHYGLMTFGQDMHIRVVRLGYKIPNLNVLANSADPCIIFGETTGTNVIVEFVTPKFMVAGCDVGAFERVFQLRGTTGTTTFRALNPSFIQEDSSLAADFIWFDVEGAGALAKIQCYQPLFHSNDAAGSAHHYIIYDATVAQLKLNSVDATALVWRTGADGPHDGVTADANGRDARYASAGTWNSQTESFGSTDLARTSTVSDSVTLTYSPTLGNNHEPFSRHRGADQYDTNTAALKLLLDVP
jgi:hypothetical protein